MSHPISPHWAWYSTYELPIIRTLEQIANLAHLFFIGEPVQPLYPKRTI